ncbi:MAG: cadherin-like beta sandwich domain-containing protein [Bacteroidales bacterium]|nr:cadherin-like beta sandwich domain-containing protein [Bacteroidales bacterium]
MKAIAFLCLFCLLAVPRAYSQTVPPLDVKPDTWHAVDGLGRTLSTYDAGDADYYSANGVGSPKNRYVGIYYFTAQGYHSTYTWPYNITERLNSVSPEVAAAATHDYYHSLWQTDQAPSWIWDEPVFGYYSTNDAFVLRKHAELLADAGVDVIFFDCTVGLTTTASYKDVFNAFSAAQQDGVRVPKIAFMLPMGDLVSNVTYLRQLWDEMYSTGLHQDLWFYWKNKPLILAYDNNLRSSSDPIDQQILNFFTFRKGEGMPWVVGETFMGTTPITPMWDWLCPYPTPKRYIDGNLEEMSVSVAQNLDVVSRTPAAMNGTGYNGVIVGGRSYSKGNYSYSFNSAGAKITASSAMQQSELYGINFQQQWDYARNAGPDFIFVTGWNEWAVGRYQNFAGIPNGFPDQYNTEYSRDAEPSAGILKDHYYYQLTENIRRFKGVSRPEPADVMKTVNIRGDLSQWNDVPSFDHYLRSTQERSRGGYQGTLYVNHTMRNDIIRAKVTYDAENLYFYVQTAGNLTAYTDPAWMRLFLDTDFTGTVDHWEGFEYVINRPSPSATKVTVERSTGVAQGVWQWETVGTADYVRTAKALQIAVPRAMLGLNKKDITFNFKWSDNMQNEGDILDFYRYGDVAPGGRFTFHFSAQDAGVQSAELKNISVSEGTLLPLFSPNVTEYELILPSWVKKLTLTGIPEQANATVTGNITEQSVAAGGVIHLTVISADNSLTKTYTITVGGTSTGMADAEKQTVKLYPNPLGGNQILHLELDRHYEQVHVKVYNTAGILLADYRSQGQRIDLSLASFAKGVYPVSVVLNEKKLMTSKVVIE